MRPMRITTTPGFLDYVDLLSRGGTEDWKALYAEARRDPRVRAELEEALEFADPEIGEARALWRILLNHLAALPQAPDQEAARHGRSEG